MDGVSAVQASESLNCATIERRVDRITETRCS